MRMELKQPYLSIKEMNGFDLPDFAVLIGRNGVGKTQLLDAIANGSVSFSDLPISEIEKYDIDTFRPSDSGRVAWGHCYFAEKTADLYFSQKSGPTLADIAEDIFTETVTNFQLREQSDERRQFEEVLRNNISQIPDFEYFTTINDSKALLAYSQQILEDVIRPLIKPKEGKSQRSQRDRKTTCGNDSAALLSLAMQLTSKFPHELLRDDVLRAAHYEGNTIENRLSQAFTRYKVEQYSWAHTQGEGSCLSTGGKVESASSSGVVIVLTQLASYPPCPDSRRAPAASPVRCGVNQRAAVIRRPVLADWPGSSCADEIPR